MDTNRGPIGPALEASLRHKLTLATTPEERFHLFNALLMLRQALAPAGPSGSFDAAHSLSDPAVPLPEATAGQVESPARRNGQRCAKFSPPSDTPGGEFSPDVPAGGEGVRESIAQ